MREHCCDCSKPFPVAEVLGFMNFHHFCLLWRCLRGQNGPLGAGLLEDRRKGALIWLPVVLSRAKFLLKGVRPFISYSGLDVARAFISRGRKITFLSWLIALRCKVWWSWIMRKGTGMPPWKWVCG